MKRSEINKLIAKSIEIFHKNKFYLPDFGYWTRNDWQEKGIEIEEIISRHLGWDITDYGKGDFYKVGLIHFTIRNGKYNSGRNYCEKIMIGLPGQKLPWHFHCNKYEDIINRGGGDLIVQVRLKTQENEFSEEYVKISVDGVKKTFQSGEKINLKPGQSIYLPAYVFHRFWANESGGIVLIGEVSSINDDKSDNFYNEKIRRFIDIEEDTEPNYLLCSDYENYIKL